MDHNKENLAGIVHTLKEQGIDAGEKEKQRIIDTANKQAETLIAEAQAASKKIIAAAELKAEQTEKNARTAIVQASRDMVEATKISMLKYLKAVFGKECKTLFNREQYLQELLKVVLDSVEGKKTVKVAPEMVKSMEAFLLSEALSEEVILKPLSSSKTKIKMKLTDKDGVDFVLSSKDVEAALFSLLNKDLVDRITKTQED